jgi:hypothetical protein
MQIRCDTYQQQNNGSDNLAEEFVLRLYVEYIVGEPHKTRYCPASQYYQQPLQRRAEKILVCQTTDTCQHTYCQADEHTDTAEISYGLFVCFDQVVGPVNDSEFYGNLFAQPRSAQ